MSKQSSDKKRAPEISQRERELLQELEEYNQERERLKEILGNVGGQSFSKKDRAINIAFLTIVFATFVFSFVIDGFSHTISLEIGVLLVSMKIVWMIHSQHKVNHFQFWMLNSIEYRLNDMARRNRQIEKGIREIRGEKE